MISSSPFFSLCISLYECFLWKCGMCIFINMNVCVNTYSCHLVASHCNKLLRKMMGRNTIRYGKDDSQLLIDFLLVGLKSLCLFSSPRRKRNYSATLGKSCRMQRIPRQQVDEEFKSFASQLFHEHKTAKKANTTTFKIFQFSPPAQLNQNGAFWVRLQTCQPNTANAS